MFNQQSIHIALLMWGCIFSLIAAFCTFIINNDHELKENVMFFLQIASAILLGADSVAWAFKGNPSELGYWMVRISNFIVFFFSDVVLLLFHAYVCTYLFQRKDGYGRHLKRVKWGYVIGGIALSLVVISQFTHLYYYFDSHNFYHRQSAYTLSLFLPLMVMMIDLSFMIQYRKEMDRLVFISMLSYIVLPCLSSIILLFYYGMSLINISISISVILMFIVSIIDRNNRLLKKEEEAIDLRIELMISQVTPHFIFNALTTIQQLCVKDPVEAQKTVKDFAVYLRGNIDSLSQKENILFSQELEHVKCYLAIEKKRFGDRIQIEYNIQEENFLIPPLTLQPIVENAVKHGICKKRGGGTIKIETKREDHQILIIVSDDGVGFDQKQEIGNDHFGIRNIQKRLQTLVNGNIKIESQVGKGTKVIITLEGSR